MDSPIRTELDRSLAALTALAPAGYHVSLHLRFAVPLMSFQTYPKAWVQRYSEKAYALRDPVVAWGLSQEGATRWSDIGIPDPFDILGDAAGHGLAHGAGIAVGPLTSRSIAGLARADRAFRDEELTEAHDIVLTMHALAEPPERLTAAQIEALSLIAEGHRHAAAAAKIGISESALKARLTSARKRLLARTTVEAIQRAQTHHLL